MEQEALDDGDVRPGTILRPFALPVRVAWRRELLAFALGVVLGATAVLGWVWWRAERLSEIIPPGHTVRDHGGK